MASRYLMRVSYVIVAIDTSFPLKNRQRGPWRSAVIAAVNNSTRMVMRGRPRTRPIPGLPLTWHSAYRMKP